MAASEGAGKRFTNPLLMLALVTACGFALRIVNIDRWPLWNDEALTILFAQWPLDTLFLRSVDTMPGLYYAVHKLLVGPLASAAEARSISLICGTLLIPATYFCAKAARVPALLSASLVALSFWLIDYSQEARSYSLLILLVVLAAAFFVRWSRDRRQGDLLASALLNLLAFYTHPVSVFWIGPISIAMLWIGRGRAILPLLLTAIVALPEIWRVTHFPREDFYWLLQASPRQAIETLSRAVLPLGASGPVAALLAVVAGYRAWAHHVELKAWVRANNGAGIILLILLVSPVLIWLAGFVAKPIFMTRTILIAVPGYMLALALLLRFEHRAARFAVVALFSVSLFFTGTTRPKEEWRVIAERVGGDPVLMCQPRQAAALRHALPGGNRFLLLYGNGLADIGAPGSLVDLFNMLSSKSRMEQAKALGGAANMNLKPVWAIRSGRSEHLPARPTMLGEAIAICEANHADSSPAYVAD